MATSIAPLYRSTSEQPDPLPAAVTGTIPNWLQGSFLRVGPGLFEIEDFTVNHWFDGFSVLDKFEICNGKVTYMKKFLQSDAYKKALVSKKPVYTEFGTKAYTDLTKNIFSRVISSVLPDLTDNCAINIFSCNGQVFVSSETAMIRQINPKTLETLEKIDVTKVGATTISSHFLKDSRGDSYTMATEIFTSAHYTVVKVPAGDTKKPFKKVQALCTFQPTHKSPCSYHSFAASDKYIVFIEQPLTLDLMKVISGQVKGRCLYECMEWQPHLLNTFHIINKETGKVLKRKYVSTKPFFVCHHINCYEEENCLVVDLVDYDSPKLFDQMYLNVVRQNKFEITNGGCAQRFVLPLIPENEDPEEGKNLVTLKTTASAERKGNVINITSQTLTSQKGYEQPNINPGYRGRKHRYVYASGMIDCGCLRNTLVKVDTETGEMKTWKESASTFPQEPYFVARPGAEAEDDGVLLVSLCSTDPSIPDAIVFFDAVTLTEVARASISCHVPNLMHGLFIPAH